MKCNSCGGRVEWQGKLSNLTHTKCLNCGAINNQIVQTEGYFDEDDPMMYDICPDCGEAFSIRQGCECKE